MNDIVERYLRAIETGDEAALKSVLHPAIAYRELPNRFVPEGSLNDRDAMLARFARGQTLLASQHYEVRDAVASGSSIALEVDWTGVLKVPLGTLAAGATMKVHSAIFLDVKDGRIVGQRNYDCVAPF